MKIYNKNVMIVISFRKKITSNIKYKMNSTIQDLKKFQHLRMILVLTYKVHKQIFKTKVNHRISKRV